jgi:hypothetical protein
MAETAAPWALDPYTNAVVDTLAADFADLHDPIIADIVRKHAYYARDRAHLELILDDPFAANWRLINRDGRLKVACWRVNPTSADRERIERVNSALDALTSEER